MLWLGTLQMSVRIAYVTPYPEAFTVPLTCFRRIPGYSLFLGAGVV